MPTVVVYEYDGEPLFSAHTDEADAYKFAVNELLAATHDNLPTATGEAREVLQQAFTLMSEGTLTYAERYTRGRPMWQRVRALVDAAALRPGPRKRDAVLRDVMVLDAAAVDALQRAAATPRPPRRRPQA